MKHHGDALRRRRPLHNHRLVWIGPNTRGPQDFKLIHYKRLLKLVSCIRKCYQQNNLGRYPMLDVSCNIRSKEMAPDRL